MTFGIFNNTMNITIDNLTGVAKNITEPTDILVRMNQTVYNGYFFIILLLVLWIILFLIAWNNNNETKGVHDIMVYLMYAGAIVSVLGILFRGITADMSGVSYSLINDYQMWIMPLITIITAVFSYMSRKD